MKIDWELRWLNKQSPRAIVFVIGALVVAAATLTILKIFRNSVKPTSIPGAIVEKYADFLEIALQFFDVQKCTQFSLESLEIQLFLQL